jgi:sugar-specific transcriptional regulator TrmB
MPLSDAIILEANPGAKPRRLFDSGGLYLEVSPAGNKLWRFKYHFEGKEKRLALGVYPATSLKAARKKRDEARELLVSGVDPGERRKVAKSLHQRGPSLKAETAKASRSKNAGLDGDAASNTLAALGVSELEEQAYRVLLVNHKAAAEEVAALLSLPLSKTKLLLEKIENKGLAIHSPERPRRYIATPPEFAAELLTKQRQADLDLARLNMRNIKRSSSSDQEPSEQAVEIITDPTMLNQFIRHIIRSAKTELLSFQRAPILYYTSTDGYQRPDSVRVRTVSDASLLANRVGLENIRRDVEAGEEARFVRELPTKMVIVDRHTAIILLSINGALEETRLIVRPSGLLDALLALFEQVWERASPIAPGGKPEVDDAIPEAPNDQLITLLSMGLNDKAIAHEAGISASTITRRIAELMQSFGTRSRFQLGWRAALSAFPERLDAGAQGD